MKVRQFMNWEYRYPAIKEYETDLTKIEKVAMKFGVSDDTIELYTDDGQLVAVATWPMGSKGYRYCDNPGTHSLERRWRR